MIIDGDALPVTVTGKVGNFATTWSGSPADHPEIKDEFYFAQTMTAGPKGGSEQSHWACDVASLLTAANGSVSCP